MLLFIRLFDRLSRFFFQQKQEQRHKSVCCGLIVNDNETLSCFHGAGVDHFKNGKCGTEKIYLFEKAVSRFRIPFLDYLKKNG